MIDYEALQNKVLSDLTSTLKDSSSNDPYTEIIKAIQSQIAIGITSAIKEYDRQRHL